MSIYLIYELEFFQLDHPQPLACPSSMEKETSDYLRH